MRIAPIALLMVVGCVALAGCTGDGGSHDDGEAVSSGSWSDEIGQAYEKASSPEIKQALEDGTISDQEYAEMKERYSHCLSAAGVTLTKYEFDGGAYSPGPGMTSDEAHAAETKCSDTSGEYPIGYLYVQMRVNPSNTDLVQATIDCYKRNGLVGPGYGRKDYQAGDLPAADRDRAVVSKCDTDPEGRLGG